MDVINGMNVALVVAHTDFQPIEYLEPKKILQSHGVNVLTASNNPGVAISKDTNVSAPIDVTLDKLDLDDLDGIFFIGGPGALTHLDNSTSYHQLIKAKDLKIPHGAICISVRILAKAGVLKGLSATGWDDDNALSGILQGYGATYEKDKQVLIDGDVVTATGPRVAKEFAQSIVQLLRQRKLSPHR